MKTSAWTPSGLLKSSGKEPAAKRLYATARKLLGDPRGTMTDAAGSFADSASAAIAVMLAWVDEKVTRAGDQQFASGMYDLLRAQESEHRIVASPFATVADRKAVLAARRKLAEGAARAPTEEALRTLLGANYAGLHVVTPAERVMWPAALGDQPMALKVPEVERKLIRIVDAICIGLGASMVVDYTPVDPAPEDFSVHTLAIGDELVLEPEISGRAERITITGLGLRFVAFGYSQRTFTAVVNNAHEPNALATTMPWPMWTSTQREIVVVVKSAAVIDAELRRQIHELLERLEPAVTTWALVQENGTPGQAGPFTLDDPTLGLLDANPLGETSVTTP